MKSKIEGKRKNNQGRKEHSIGRGDFSIDLAGRFLSEMNIGAPEKAGPKSVKNPEEVKALVVTDLGKEKIDSNSSKNDPKKIHRPSGTDGSNKEGTSELKGDSHSKRDSFEREIKKEIHETKGEAVE